MEVYVPLSAEGFELCHPERHEDFETLNAQINGTPRGLTWRPIPVRLIQEDQGKKLAASDSPWLGSHALIFRQPAVDMLGALLTKYGEMLTLKCPEADLFVFNATCVLDALDEQASKVTRFSTGRLMRVTRYVFRATAIGGFDVFKIPNLRVSPTFVSERVVESWSLAGLRGLVFNKVWST
jgi:hypothetical protein